MLVCVIEYYSAIKREGNVISFDSMDEPGGHYFKWNKPGSEEQVPHDPTEEEP